MIEKDYTYLEEELQKLLKWKKSKQFYADKLGITVDEVDSLLKEIYGKDEMSTSQLDSIKFGFSEDIKGGRAESTFDSLDEIRSMDDLITKGKIDIDKWDIVKWVQNYWGNKDNPHWQVKVWLEPKKANIEEIVSSILENYKSSYKPLSKDQLLLNNKQDTRCSVEISLYDFHIDKKDIDNSSIEDRSKQFINGVNWLINKCYWSINIDEVIFVVGNDFFNTDNFQNSTTALTPQNVNTSWEKAYEVGFDTLVKSISIIRQFCNKLKVILVAGNHAKTKEYYLTHALEVFFSSDNSIIFDRSSSPRKAVLIGNTFVGYHHGNCKIDQLPLIAAKEFSSLWGKAKYHEIHTGDKHFYMEKEISGVRIKQIPSMSGTDSWHNENNFVNGVRSGLALVYDNEKGKIAEFEYRI